MFRRAILTIALAAAGFFAWQNSTFLREPKACEEPIAYTTGSFDRRFGISHQDFLQALVSAEALWEQPSGRDLFVYSPEGSSLSVNLIYDYRQETTSTLSDLGETLERNEATYNAWRAEYLSLKAEYDRAKGLYEARVEIFNKTNDAYAAEVEQWNKGPRTSKNQLEKLERSKEALEREAGELKRLEGMLNQVAGEINALVAQLNELASYLNLNVERYNTIGAARGETFTGGVFSEAGNERSIDIFEFSDRTRLVRILAHEFGHALGLEHNSDTDAIMYYLNRGEMEKLSATDLASLDALCGTE